jgi:protein SDA1
LLPSLFKLFRVNDKPLRKLVHNVIIGDIAFMNEKKHDVAMNKYLQNFMYQMLDDPNRTAAKKSLDVMIQLYYKKVWNDERTVNVISTACLSPDASISTAGLKFFLGTNSGVDDEDTINQSKVLTKETKAKTQVQKLNGNITKKSKKRDRQYKKAVKLVISN